MTFSRFVLTADVTVPAGVPGAPAAGPAVTVSGTSDATPDAGSVIVTQAIGAGTYLLSWTAQLETAAADGDAGNFGLYGGDGTTLLATSVNAGTPGSYPQAPVSYYTGSAAVLNIGNVAAGTAGSVYAASLTVTPAAAGGSNGTVGWAGPGSPAGWTAGGFPVTFPAGTPLWLDTDGPLYAALGGEASLRAWIDGTDDTGHGRWAALSN